MYKKKKCASERTPKISLLLLKINSIIAFCNFMQKLRHDFLGEPARSVRACAPVLTHCVIKCSDQNKCKRNATAIKQIVQLSRSNARASNGPN